MFLRVFFSVAILVAYVCSQPCDRTYVLQATGTAGEYGYPKVINLPHPRTSNCVIRLINHDVYEHGISPVKPADGSISLAGFYFGGQVVYPSTTAGLGSQEVTFTVKPDWPQGTYEYYCIFHGTAGKIVIGSGAGCTLPVQGCIPTDPPTASPALPCGQACQNLVPQLPTCAGDTQITYLGQAFCHVETQTCQFPTSSNNCALTAQGVPSGQTCRNGVCVPVTGDPNPLPDTGFCLPCNEAPPNSCKTIGGNPHYVSIKPDVGTCGLNANGGYQCNYSPAMNIDCTTLNAVCVGGACVSNVPAAPSPPVVVTPPTPGNSVTTPPTPNVGVPTAPSLVPQQPTPRQPTPPTDGTPGSPQCLTTIQCSEFCGQAGFSVCDCTKITCNQPEVIVPQAGLFFQFPDDGSPDAGTTVQVDGTGKTSIIVPGKPLEVAVTEPLGDGTFLATTSSGTYTVDTNTGTVVRGGAPSCTTPPFEMCNRICNQLLSCSCQSIECFESDENSASTSVLSFSAALLLGSLRLF